MLRLYITIRVLIILTLFHLCSLLQDVPAMSG